jgi:hypothetical protein
MSEPSPTETFLKFFPGWLKPIGGVILWVLSLFSENAGVRRRPLRVVHKRSITNLAKQSDGTVLTQAMVDVTVTNLSDWNLLLVNAYLQEPGFEPVKAIMNAPTIQANSVYDVRVVAFLPGGRKPMKLILTLEDNVERKHQKTIHVERHA